MLTIGNVARRVGLRPSALRYYSSVLRGAGNSTPSLVTVPLKNGFRITRINDDLNLDEQQSTPSARPFRTYPETMEEPFGHWTEFWDVLDWLEYLLRLEV